MHNDMEPSASHTELVRAPSPDLQTFIQREISKQLGEVTTRITHQVEQQMSTTNRMVDDRLAAISLEQVTIRSDWNRQQVQIDKQFLVQRVDSYNARLAGMQHRSRKLAKYQRQRASLADDSPDIPRLDDKICDEEEWLQAEAASLRKLYTSLAQDAESSGVDPASIDLTLNF